MFSTSELSPEDEAELNVLRMALATQNHLCKTLSTEKCATFQATRRKMMTATLTKLEVDTFVYLTDTMRESEVIENLGNDHEVEFQEIKNHFFQEIKSHIFQEIKSFLIFGTFFRRTKVE
jgi:hypothetical protein